MLKKIKTEKKKKKKRLRERMETETEMERVNACLCSTKNRINNHPSDVLCRTEACVTLYCKWSFCVHGDHSGMVNAVSLHYKPASSRVGHSLVGPRVHPRVGFFFHCEMIHAARE